MRVTFAVAPEPVEEAGPELSESDLALIEKLVGYGFAEDKAKAAYLAAEKNFDLAAATLFEEGMADMVDDIESV